MTTQRYLWAHKFDKRIDKVGVQNPDGSLAQIFDGFDQPRDNPFDWSKEKPLVYFWVDPGEYWVTTKFAKGASEQKHALVKPEPTETIDFRDGHPLVMRKENTVWDEFVVNESAYGKLTIPQDSMVMDIGGHIGVFARDALRRGARHVTAYEPEPRNLDVLYQNAEGFDIDVVPAAVTSNVSDSAVTFWVNYQGGTALHSLHAKGGKVPWPVPRADFIEEVRRYEPDVIKCDIEGGEYFLDWPSLPGFVKHVAMEIHLTQHAWRDEHFPRLVTEFKKLGFEAVREPKGAQRSTIGIWSRA